MPTSVGIFFSSSCPRVAHPICLAIALMTVCATAQTQFAEFTEKQLLSRPAVHGLLFAGLLR
jgi:hypothetical protein